MHDRDREGRLKKETGHLDASSDTDEGSQPCLSVALGSMNRNLSPPFMRLIHSFFLFYQARATKKGEKQEKKTSHEGMIRNVSPPSHFLLFLRLPFIHFHSFSAFISNVINQNDTLMYPNG